MKMERGRRSAVNESFEEKEEEKETDQAEKMRTHSWKQEERAPSSVKDFEEKKCARFGSFGFD